MILNPTFHIYLFFHLTNIITYKNIFNIIVQKQYTKCQYIVVHALCKWSALVTHSSVSIVLLPLYIIIIFLNNGGKKVFPNIFLYKK